jgi:5-methylcytosine-specific restriction endonuclease McrA
MNKRNVWNARRRFSLLQVLGGRCQHCGTTDNLTFDCIRPTGDLHHRMSSVQRMSYYIHEARKGNVQVLCFDCNIRKSNLTQQRYTPCPAHTK